MSFLRKAVQQQRSRLYGGAVGSRKLFSTSASREKIFELRTYAMQPAKARECMKIVDELIPIRAKFSKLNGYWYTELGGLNEITFLWEFGRCFHVTIVKSKVVALPLCRQLCPPHLS